MNFRIHLGHHGRGDHSIAQSFAAMAAMQREGLIRHLGISNATAAQVAEARGIAYVPFFPLCGFNPLQSATLSTVAERLGATPMQVALAWLLRRSPIILLIPGTSAAAHLRENLAAASLVLPDEAVAALDGIAGNQTAG